MGSEPRQTGGPGAIGRIQVIRGYPPPEAQQNSGLIWLRGSWVDLAWDHPAFYSCPITRLQMRDTRLTLPADFLRDWR